VGDEFVEHEPPGFIIAGVTNVIPITLGEILKIGVNLKPEPLQCICQNLKRFPIWEAARPSPL
jgi:hypothetical protein